MMEELDKKAKKEMLDELQRVMKEMMLEGDSEDAMPVAAEVSVMSAEPIEGEEMEMSEDAPEMEYEAEDEDDMDVDLSDPEMLAKFKEFLKAKKEEV